MRPTKVRLKRHKKIQYKHTNTKRELTQGYCIVAQTVLILLLSSISFIVGCSGFYIKPILYIPIVVTLGMFSEDEVTSAIVGGASGLLLDVCYNRLIGFNGIILLTVCVATTLLFKNYLRPIFFNALTTTIVFTAMQGIIDYYFYYRVWHYDDYNTILYNYTVPTCIITVVSLIVVYPIIKAIKTKIVVKE